MGSLRVMENEITLNRGPENPWHTAHTNTDKAKDSVTEAENKV